MASYIQNPGYHHYKSVAFARSLWFSGYIFDSIVRDKYFPREWHGMRPWGMPNTPAELDDGESTWSSDDGYEHQHWGADEDWYVSLREEWWF